MDYNINTTFDSEVNYDYKEKSIYNKILTKLSTIFGGLDYNQMKIDDVSSVSDLPLEQWEYYRDNTSSMDVKDWNLKGSEGWELVNLIDGFLIWKRKIK